MMRRILNLPATLADYTIGTVIVLVQLAITGPAASRAPSLPASRPST